MRIRSAILLTLLLGIFAQDISAQKIFKRKKPDIFPLNGRYKLSGFFIAPGATYTLTRFTDEQEEVFSAGDSTYNATFKPEGGFGMYLEGGWYKVFKYSSLIRYMDVSLAYKQLKGAESFEGELIREGGNPIRQEFDGEGDFNDNFLTLSLNFSNVAQLSDRTFLQNSLGANFDYLFSGNRSYTPEFGLNRQEFTEDPRLQIHYRLGFGWKMSHKVLLIPTFETPILSCLLYTSDAADD